MGGLVGGREGYCIGLCSAHVCCFAELSELSRMLSSTTVHHTVQSDTTCFNFVQVSLRIVHLTMLLQQEKEVVP